MSRPDISVDAPDDFGQHAIHYAAVFGKDAALEALCEAKADGLRQNIALKLMSLKLMELRLIKHLLCTMQPEMDRSNVLSYC